MADDNKINIDVFNFDEKSYRQALDILQNPDAKFYITAKDIVRGWVNPEQRRFTFANAADLISRWPDCVNVAIPDTPLTKIEQLFNPDLPANAKIPEGAIEVKPDRVIQFLKWSLETKKSFSEEDGVLGTEFICADPRRLNDLEGLVKCVDHGLENYPNLAREVGDNKIPEFADPQSNPVVAHFRDKYDIDFAKVIDERIDSDKPVMSEDDFLKLGDAMLQEFRPIAEDVCRKNGLSFENVYPGGTTENEALGEWANDMAEIISEYKSMDELRNYFQEKASVDLLLTHYKNEGERFCVKTGLDFDSVFPDFDKNFIDQPEMTSLRAKVLEEYKAAQNKGVSFDNLLNSIGGSAVLEVDRCITNLDLDNNFVKPLYQKSLDNLKQDHEVKYYIDEAGIRKHLSRNPVSAEGSPTPDSMLKGWSWLDSVKTAANGNIPVGAAEVKMASSNVSLDPVYRIDDLPRASAFAWCLEQKKPFIESQYTDTIDAHCPAFCFASDKDFDRCQAMIASLELVPESFNEEVYSQALQDLSLGQECKYYITQDSICDWVNNNMDPDYATAADAIEDYPITVKCAEDGRIPEGAIEVICNPDKLDPKFRVEDVDQAISIQLALRTKEPLSSIQKLDHTRDAFGFPSNKAYDQCQTLIDACIKKDPPVR